METVSSRLIIALFDVIRQFEMDAQQTPESVDGWTGRRIAGGDECGDYVPDFIKILTMARIAYR